MIFIVLLIGSAGTASIVYVILWLMVPPARTAAEKLQLRGQPVTLASIKQLGEGDDTGNPGAETARRVVRYGAGLVLVAGAIGALVATVTIAGGLIFGTSDNSPLAGWRPTESWWLALALSLFVLAGLLLSALGFVLADATFRRRWSRRIGTSVVVIITAGMLAFISGAGTVWYGMWQEGIRYSELRKTSYVNLPANFTQVTAVTVSGDQAHGLAIEYIVADTPRYELDALPGVRPEIAINGDGTSATISLTSTNEQVRPYLGYAQPSLKLYGPALEAIDVKNATIHYYTAAAQDVLALTSEASSLALAGAYKTVRAYSKDGSEMTLRSATIENLDVRLTGGQVAAGVVRTLSVQQPDACPAHEDDEQNRVVVQAVSSGKLRYNGGERTAQTVMNDCGAVVVGDKDRYEGREE